MIETLLKNQITSSKEILQKLETSIKDINIKILAELELVKEATYILQGMCKHININKVNQIYVSGGYEHVSEEHYTVECVDCKKVLDSRCIRGTYA